MRKFVKLLFYNVLYLNCYLIFVYILFSLIILPIPLLSGNILDFFIDKYLSILFYMHYLVSIFAIFCTCFGIDTLEEDRKKDE